jgi:hypothetical protein
MKLLETTRNKAWKGICSHALESTDVLFHRSSPVHHEKLCGHGLPGFATGLFCNNRVYPPYLWLAILGNNWDDSSGRGSAVRP